MFPGDSSFRPNSYSQRRMPDQPWSTLPLLPPPRPTSSVLSSFGGFSFIRDSVSALPPPIEFSFPRLEREPPPLLSLFRGDKRFEWEISPLPLPDPTWKVTLPKSKNNYELIDELSRKMPELSVFSPTRSLLSNEDRLFKYNPTAFFWSRVQQSGSGFLATPRSHFSSADKFQMTHFGQRQIQAQVFMSDGTSVSWQGSAHLLESLVKGLLGVSQYTQTRPALTDADAQERTGIAFNQQRHTVSPGRPTHDATPVGWELVARTLSEAGQRNAMVVRGWLTGEQARRFGSVVTHEALSGVSGLVSFVPQLLEEIKAVGHRVVPKCLQSAGGVEITPMKNFEETVATCHRMADQFFATDLGDSRGVSLREKFGVCELPLPCANPIVINRLTNVVQYTKSNLRLGQRIHLSYKAAIADKKNLRKEYILPSGRKIDFIDMTNGKVYELKPNNPRAIRGGMKQLERYITELKSMPRYENVNWEGVLELY